jgi:hypothetical protein
MFGQPPTAGRVIRWIARLLSLFNAVVLLLSVFGEPFPVSRITAAQWLAFAMFPVGVVVGFIVSLHKVRSNGSASDRFQLTMSVL